VNSKQMIESVFVRRRNTHGLNEQRLLLALNTSFLASTGPKSVMLLPDD